MIKENLGEIIKYKRLELKIRQEDLCEGICTPSYYSRIENNRVQASPEVYEMLFKKLGLKQHIPESLEHENKRLEVIYTNILNRKDISSELGFLKSLIESSTPLYTKSLIIYCRHLLNEGQIQEAKKIIVSLEKAIDPENDSRIYFMHFCAKVYLQALSYNREESALIIEEIEHIKFEKLESSSFEKGLVFYNIGYIYEKAFKYKKALPIVHQARDIFYGTFSLKHLFSCNILLGILYNADNNAEESLKYYEYARGMLEYIEPTNQTYYEYMIINNLGYVKEKNNDFEGAIECYLEALKFQTNYASKSVVLSNLIQLYIKLNLLEDAKSYYKQFKATVTEDSSEEMILQKALFKIILFKSVEDIKEVIDFVDGAMQYFETNNYWAHISFYGFYLAEYFEELNYYKFATKLLRLAIKANSILMKGVE